MKSNPSPQMRPRLARRVLRTLLVASTVAGATGVFASGCLNRDVSPAQPNTTNIFVTQITNEAVDKIDLLFVLDNSVSMADKQQILREAVPPMLGRLLNPGCEDEAGNVTAKPAGMSTCPAPLKEEFSAIGNMHIGVLSSSVSGHVASSCRDATKVGSNDRGELIMTSAERPTAPPSWNNTGFLAWDTRGAGGVYPHVPPAETNLAALQANLEGLVAAVGETGCGYEAPLEAWYRFLVDPQPFAEAVPPSAGQVTTTFQGINHTILQQRAQFLRPDSLVAIVMLSDENDCSVGDHQQGHLLGATGGMPKGTSACQQDPNDKCCRYCNPEEGAPPSGCTPVASDPGCALDKPIDDTANLRCYEQRRRFGVEVLASPTKYANSLMSGMIYGRPCASDADCVVGSDVAPDGVCTPAGGAAFCLFPNPLMSPSRIYPDLVPRGDSGLIFLAGIIGVPWQDVATAETLNDPSRLELRSNSATEAGEMLATQWPIMLGDPANNVYPLDPFMWESVDPRFGNHHLSGQPIPAANPITGDAPQPPSAPGAASPINGHEYTPDATRSDLQYACVFPLGASRTCEVSGIAGCDCSPSEQGTFQKPDNPLCQAAGSTQVTSEQIYAKAYPGTRFLDVLKQYGLNSIVASVCPKVTTGDSTNPAYGYNPAVDAIINRLKEKLKGACLPRALQVREDGTVACEVMEITQPNAPFPTGCQTPGRTDPDPEIAGLILEEYRKAGRCGPESPSGIDCASLRLCKLVETMDPLCLNDTTTVSQDPNSAGYCYIDAMQDRNQDGVFGCSTLGDEDCIGNPQNVDSCPASQRRILKFLTAQGVEPKVPYDNSSLIVACQGAPI